MLIVSWRKLVTPNDHILNVQLPMEISVLKERNRVMAAYKKQHLKLKGLGGFSEEVTVEL